MSANSFKFDGLAELMRDLRNLPSHLAEESSGIVGGAADDAKAEIVSEYAIGPTADTRRGDLRAKVTVRKERTRFGASAVVRSASKHAMPYEFGTQVRYDRGASRGVMPSKPTVIPISNKHRRQMYTKLSALLERNGLTVTGDAQ